MIGPGMSDATTPILCVDRTRTRQASIPLRFSAQCPYSGLNIGSEAAFKSLLNSGVAGGSEACFEDVHLSRDRNLFPGRQVPTDTPIR